MHHFYESSCTIKLAYIEKIQLLQKFIIPLGARWLLSFKTEQRGESHEKIYERRKELGFI